jgi:hypothetical protein
MTRVHGSSAQKKTFTDFAVRTRYPGEEPTLDESKEAFAHAKLVRNLARKLLGI